MEGGFVMLAVLNLVERIFDRIDRALAPWLLPALARFVFAATLAVYYWKSAASKLGDGIFSLSVGAYAQIFPKAMEAASYNLANLSFPGLRALIVYAATYGEFILPFLIIVGLLTRLAALGMIGFVTVQSIVDITGHGLSEKSIGAWFDNVPDSLILDQRAFWIFLLLFIVAKGGGSLAIDRLLIDSRRQERSENSS